MNPNTWDWQNFVVLSLVAGAAGYLVSRLAARFRRKQTGCGSGCGSCTAGNLPTSGDSQATVSREQLEASAKRLRESRQVLS